MSKIIVVGGVAGGASFAARMRRLDENAEIIIFERGEFISFANCGLPYYIGDTIKKRDQLILQTPESFRSRFNIEVRINSEVTAVNTKEKSVTVISSHSEYKETFDYLVLSPGATPLRPPIPGIASDKIFTLRSIPDMDTIKSQVDQELVKKAVVVGGGFIGLEMAENLRNKGLEVTLVELLDQVFIPADKEMAAILHKHLKDKGVELLLSDGAKEFVDSSESGVDIVLNSGTMISADMVLLAIGVRPDTGFLKESGIELNDRGAIIVNEHLQTNTKDIYAVGDAIEVTDFISNSKVQAPLAGPANRQGRIVANNIAGIQSTYNNTQGTAICKIFDLTAAVTGINEKNARQQGLPFLKSYTYSPNHAEYFPGATDMAVKIMFRENDGRLLGAQVIGKNGVDKRIDVFATAIRQKLTVYDLTHLELAYAPPYGVAKDPVNIAGFVAENILEKRVTVIHAEDVANFDPSKQILLDVRTTLEHKRGHIENSMHIPIDTLRTRLAELDRSKEILVYCAIGLRGYLAARILTQRGFTVKNLSGGFFMYFNYI